METQDALHANATHDTYDTGEATFRNATTKMVRARAVTA